VGSSRIIQLKGKGAPLTSASRRNNAYPGKGAPHSTSLRHHVDNREGKIFWQTAAEPPTRSTGTRPSVYHLQAVYPATGFNECAARPVGLIEQLHITAVLVGQIPAF